MSVVIDEVITESGAAPAPAAAAVPAASADVEPDDLDRLDYELARRRHRAERLWAD
jgi:hypothetical protein